MNFIKHPQPAGDRIPGPSRRSGRFVTFATTRSPFCKLSRQALERQKRNVFVLTLIMTLFNTGQANAEDWRAAAQRHSVKIEVPVLRINSADDFINPPGLGDPEALAAQTPNARFVLVPATAENRGLGIQPYPIVWKDDLASFLADYP